MDTQDGKDGNQRGQQEGQHEGKTFAKRGPKGGRKPSGPGANPLQVGVGRLMASRRRQLGLSLSDLADVVGVTKSYLSSIETHKRPYAPSEDLVAKLEDALRLSRGEMLKLAQWQATPPEVRQTVERLTEQQRAARRVAELLRAGAPRENPALPGQSVLRSLDDLFRTGELKQLIEQMDPSGSRPTAESEAMLAVRQLLPTQVPLINSVAAGYPSEFTDLGYPARIADEYVPGAPTGDPDAFAARVVGDSMEPDYREGDIVIFSPTKRMAVDGGGTDCFVRLEPDHESTFKRVFFEKNHKAMEVIRLQPLNSKYPARIVPREKVAGCYPAVSVTRDLAGPRR